MAENLLRLNYYPRNAFRRTALQTAQRIAALIVEIRDPSGSTAHSPERKDETFNDARLLWRVVKGPRISAEVTSIGERYLDFYNQNPTAAYEWLAIRSGWLYSMPNASNSDFSSAAKALGFKVNLLDLLVRTLDLLTRDSQSRSVLTYAEYVTVLSRDSAWNWNPYGIYDQVTHLRQNPEKLVKIASSKFLGAESELSLTREALNTPLRKFAIQCGLFEHVGSPEHLESPTSGLSLSRRLRYDVNLRNMYEHILKYPRHDLEESSAPDVEL